MTRDFKLANIILKVDKHAEDYPELYYRAKKGAAVYNQKQGHLLLKDTVDFFTYVNGCSWGKWRKYTGVSQLFLHLELTGSGTVDLLALTYNSEKPRSETKTVPEVVVWRAEVDKTVQHLAQHEFDGKNVALDLEFNNAEADLVGFTITPAKGKTVEIARAYYCTRVEEAALNPVRLALSTTTFNNEKYILPNIDLVKKGIAAEGGTMAENFHMFVVDNGRTLDGESLSDNIVTVIPNPNTGGAGGFARGMMAATEEGADYTHILLMDDDVSIMPESLIRTYNLLTLAQGKYKGAFINGAMLSLEEPTRQFEDVSIVDRTAVYRKIKPDYDLSEVADILDNEFVDVEVPKAYGAWWYSCIPISAVRKNGLPIPFFIRCDDIDFGLRNTATFMTMSSICVWHQSFEGRFRPSVDWYQYTRNFAALIALNDCASEFMFVERLRRSIRQNLRDLDYVSAEMLLEGFNDYLKGPEYLQHVNGSALMKENGKRNEKLVPVEELDPAILKEAGVTPEVLANDDMNDYTTYFKSYMRVFPYDKHRLPKGMQPKRTGYVVKYGDAILEGTSYRCETVVFIDPTRKKGCIRRMDMPRYNKIRAFEKEVFTKYRKEGKAIRQAWKDAAPYMTSRAFWEAYLKEQSQMM